MPAQHPRKNVEMFFLAGVLTLMTGIDGGCGESSDRRNDLSAM